MHQLESDSRLKISQTIAKSATSLVNTIQGKIPEGPLAQCREQARDAVVHLEDARHVEIFETRGVGLSQRDLSVAELP